MDYNLHVKMFSRRGTAYSVMLYNLEIIDEDYENLTDNELIEKIRNGEEQAEKYFYTRYIHLVKKMVSSFFLLGGEKDDLFQEAMIGLLKAVKNYNSDINSNFKYFAELCIKRQIISAIRKSKGYEKNLLNKSISIYQLTDMDHEECILDKIEGLDSLNPESVIICKEERNDYYQVTAKILSHFEKMVLMEYGRGKTYQEISVALKKDIKSIDNALQRIKKKINNNKDKMLNM